MSNKIINRYLLPYYITTVLMITGAIVTEVNLNKYHVEGKKAIEQGAIKAIDVMPYFLMAAIIIITFVMAEFTVISLQKRADNFANDVVIKYLTDFFNAYPEYKKHMDILKNPKTVQNIATFLSNKLTDAEQKEIIEIVRSIGSKDDKQNYNYSEAVQKALVKITNVVKKHNKSDPYFSAELLKFIMNAEKTYAIPTKQKVYE